MVQSSLTVSIVIPTLNEAENLPLVLPQIPHSPEVVEILLVDGSSTDGTPDVARGLLPDIKVIHQDGRGKGNAVKCGARAAIGDYFLVLDADGSQIPDEIPQYISKATEGYDLVKGSRYLTGRDTKDETLDRVVIVSLTYLVANTLWRTRFTDIGYGMFLINRKRFLELDIRSDYLEMEYELMIKAKRSGLSIVEVPAHEAARVYGKSHLTYSHDGRLIFQVVMGEWLRGIAHNIFGRKSPGQLGGY